MTTDNWPTKARDIFVAEQLMEDYAKNCNSNTLGLFELVVDQEEKRMNFRLSQWVLMLVEHFQSLYGASHGVFVARNVITRCLTNGETLH